MFMYRNNSLSSSLSEYTKIANFSLTNRYREVVNCTRSYVKNNSKLTNLMKISRIEGYNGKYGSNPQEIRKISDDRI